MERELAEYIRDFNLRVDTYTSYKKFPVFYKNETVEKMCNEYIERVGKKPSPKTLNKLANWILADVLLDKTSNKARKDEYPVVSKSQLKRRTDREVHVDNTVLDYLDQKYNKRLANLNKRKTSETNEG